VLICPNSVAARAKAVTEDLLKRWRSDIKRTKGGWSRGFKRLFEPNFVKCDGNGLVTSENVVSGRMRNRCVEKKNHGPSA
jgi:hypothetical protein